MPGDGEEDDDDKEWKSSHERFVEALARFTRLQERVMEKQETIAYGFTIEVSRKELLDHFIARAAFHSDDAFKISEENPLASLPSQLFLADGSPIEHAQEAVEMVKKKHRVRIENAQAKAKSFEFAATHLPKDKKTWVLQLQEAYGLELIPGLQEEPFVPGAFQHREAPALDAPDGGTIPG